MALVKDPVAEHIRARTTAITEEWMRVVRERLPAIANMSKPMLLDHMPELLQGLAAWVDGDAKSAEDAFDALVKGHALQRLGWGVGIETLTHEYMYLRAILLRDLLQVASVEGVRESLIRANEGLDFAMSRGLDYYASQREVIRDRFIGILGHDLRGPLGTIGMAAAMLQQGTNLDPKLLGERIASSAQRMLRMVEDVLDFARGHLGGGIPATAQLDDLGEISNAAVEEVRQAHPQRRVNLERQGELRGPLDRDRVLQALSNLLTNAVQHGEGDIEVRAYETEDKQHICVSVTSHGPPIAPERLAQLFDPFSRATDANARSGLGLGLYIVDQIMLAHGGTVDVTSEGNDTTFTMRFPRVPGEQRRELAKP